MPINTRMTTDACSLLDADHRHLKQLFKSYQLLLKPYARATTRKKQDLAKRICLELKVHAQIEEEIFYPALLDLLTDTQLLDTAEVEHASAMNLMDQLEAATEVDNNFDAIVTVLGEQVDHHIRKERSRIFTKARASKKLDLIAMCHRLQARKTVLMDQLQVTTTPNAKYQMNPDDHDRTATVAMS